MYEKGVKKAEQVKLQHQQQLKQSKYRHNPHIHYVTDNWCIAGQWKESDDDPFSNLKDGYQEMISQKQR